MNRGRNSKPPSEANLKKLAFEEFCNRTAKQPLRYVTSAEVTEPGPETPTAALDEYIEDCKFRGCSSRTIKESAEEILKQVELARTQGPPFTLTVRAESKQSPKSLSSTQEVIDKFLKAKKGKLKPDSITSYSAVLRPFARACPELPLEPEQIETYLDNFSHENTSAQYKFSVLRTFYLWLSRRNLIAVNPIKMVEKPGGQADEVLPLNEEQVRLLHDMPKTSREQGYIGLMLGHGFRLSEVIRLDVGDIHEDRIWVHGKERKEWFPLLSEVRDWLLDLADGRDSSQPLFAGRQGRLSDSQVQYDIRKLLQCAGINGVRQSPHTLRHTFSTMAYLAGCDWDAVELLLRQREKKRNVTNRYIHLSPEQRLRLMREKLERYSPLRGAKSELGEKPDFTQLDAGELLPQLIDQLIALGETAKELKRQLGSNGHRAEKLEEIKEYLKQP